MADLESLTENARFLARNAVLAKQRAAELLSWWKDRNSAGTLRVFRIDPRDLPGLHLECFYDKLELGGQSATVQGCSWKVRFIRDLTTSSGGSMESFIRTQFPLRCHWTHRDGLPGGFHFKPLQYKLIGKEDYGVFPPEASPSCIGEVGVKYDWVVTETQVYDFFRNVPGFRPGRGLLSRMPKMASYTLMDTTYYSSFQEPVKGAVADCCFGYSFLPVPVTYSIFGYGPGKFAAALKQFRWVLLDNSDVEIQMLFLVSPRSEKILSLWGFDPIYFSADLLNALTLNLFKIRQRIHNKMDAFQLELHARVYQSLLDGMKSSWVDQDWISGVQRGTPAPNTLRST